jgi:ABC-type glycerol-3-phosphate transport system substrate-binding protein
MKSSPFQIVLLAVFGALGVAAVMVFAIIVSGNSGGGVGQVTIWGTFDESRVTAVLRAASEADERLNNVTYVRKDPRTYQTDLVNAMASGSGPDLYFMTDDRAIADAAKTMHIPFSSLSQTQFQTTFLDAAAPFVGSDGIIAVPLTADPLVLFWNKDLLAAAGFTAPPRYWDEFLGVAQKLTERTDSGVITKSGVALGQYDNIADAQDILTALVIQAGGAITGRDATGKLYSALSPQQGSVGQPSLSALRYYVSFADPSQDNYSWNKSLPEARIAFAQGSAALYIGHASESALITQTNPNLSFALAPLPQLRGAKVRNVATVYGLAIPRTAGLRPTSLDTPLGEDGDTTLGEVV